MDGHFLLFVFLKPAFQLKDAFMWTEDFILEITASWHKNSNDGCCGKIIKTVSSGTFSKGISTVDFHIPILMVVHS